VAAADLLVPPENLLDGFVLRALKTPLSVESFLLASTAW